MVSKKAVGPEFKLRFRLGSCSLCFVNYRKQNWKFTTENHVFLRRPNFPFKFSVSSSEFSTFTSQNQLQAVPITNQLSDQFTLQSVRAKPNPNKPTIKEIKNLWPDAKEQLEFLGRYLPKQRLISAIQVLSDARKRRFLRSRIPKYGTINKGFTDQELIRFLNTVEDPRFRLLFTYQAVLGLRIGEVVKIHVKNINLQTRELTIDNQKASRADCLPIPPQLFEQTLQYINDYESSIVNAKGGCFGLITTQIKTRVLICPIIMQEMFFVKQLKNLN